MSRRRPRPPIAREPTNDGRTADSFQNFQAALGLGTNNVASGATYGFNPITRNHVTLEWMYRGSWLVRAIVDSVADDMTRAGISFNTDLSPDQTDKLQDGLVRLVWDPLCSTIKWARLYGGAIGVIWIDGQKMDTPLRVNTIGKGQFKMLLPLDRWQLQPVASSLVKEAGPHFGKPEFYTTVQDNFVLQRMRIHYTRVVRFEGSDLPYWQRVQENGWALSVIEPFYDRMVAYDSTSTGAAQLVYKAHLRTYSVEKLRELIATGGKAYQALLQQIQMIRMMQSNEGITLMDATDKFEATQYAFSGLSDILTQFGQQLSGAAGIPLTRLFGQSPAGMNSTGESDLRNYYDMINAQQRRVLTAPLMTLLRVLARSELGLEDLPDGFGFSFNPLWQMTDEQKAQHASSVTDTVTKVFDTGLISPHTALKELRQASRINGVWTNIKDEDIEAAAEDPPAPDELAIPETGVPKEEAGNEEHGDNEVPVAAE